MPIAYIGRQTVYESTRAYNAAARKHDDWRQSNNFPIVYAPCEIALAVMPFHDEAFHKAVFDIAIDRGGAASDPTIGTALRNQSRLVVRIQNDNPSQTRFELYIGDVSGVTYPFWLYLWMYPIGEAHPVLPSPPPQDLH